MFPTRFTTARERSSMSVREAWQDLLKEGKKLANTGKIHALALFVKDPRAAGD